MNLYGYANGDPINNSDPFGLSADTVVTSEQADVADCKQDPACAKAYAAADAAPFNVYLNRVGSDAVCGNVPAACTFHGVPDKQIFYSPGDFGKAAALFGVGQVSIREVLAHELMHAVTGPGELIPRMFQNSVRSRIPLPLITQWPP